MEKKYKTKKEEMKNEKTAGNAVVFENPEFGKILTQTDENGEPLFCAKDVCNALGYKNLWAAIQRHVDDPYIAKRDVWVVTGKKKDGVAAKRLQQMLFVNESGFYALVLGSKLPTAVKFKNWVTSEVLPQIRKTGGYIPIQQGESDEETIRHAEEILRATLKEKENLLKNQQVQIDQQKKLIGEQDTEIRRLNGVVDEQVVCIAKNGENIIQLENQVDHLLPKALYTDNVLNSVSCFTTTQIAKELGITAQELNRQLCALHMAFCVCAALCLLVEPPALCPSYPVLPERPVSALCRLCPHGLGEEPHPLLYPSRPSLRWGTGEAGHRLHPYLPRMDRKRKEVHTFKGKKVKK